MLSVCRMKFEEMIAQLALLASAERKQRTNKKSVDNDFWREIMWELTFIFGHKYLNIRWNVLIEI